jgi:hypothetical protein
VRDVVRLLPYIPPTTPAARERKGRRHEQKDRENLEDLQKERNMDMVWVGEWVDGQMGEWVDGWARERERERER